MYSDHSNTRSVLFVTGIRSEYDLLQPIIRAVSKKPGMVAQVVVSGAHLSEQFGLTVREVEADGVEIVARIPSLLNADAPWCRAKSAAIQMMGLVDTVLQRNPSCLFVLGDREEVLAASAMGAYMGIPVAHMGGGDTSYNGHIDNSVRHAATKFAHLHFVATEQSRERVEKLGEEPWRIHVVGATGLDRFLSVPEMSLETVRTRLELEDPTLPIILVIQHSMNDSPDLAERQMRETLEAVREIKAQVVVGYPNCDAGGQRIISVIEEYVHRFPAIRAYRNLPRDLFVNLLRVARVLVGNSSLGIIEAPMLKLPYICVGERQYGREHADNVRFVAAMREPIAEGVRMALQDPVFLAKVHSALNPYGDGRAGERVAEILCNTPLNEHLLAKKITY